MPQTSILLLTTEPLPLAGCAATGAGLRAWGLAQGLRGRGFDVILATPEALENRPRPAELQRHNVQLFKRAELDALIARIKPDALLLQHWSLTEQLGEHGLPLAIDLAGPHLLERLYWDSPDPARDRMLKLDALRRADFVCCSGAYQRHYFLPFLAGAGWNITAPGVCPAIPFSIDPNTPPEVERDYSRIVFGGYFLPWQDPSAGIEACLETLEESDRGTLEFYGGAHPALDVSGGRFAALVEKLRGHPRVEMRGTLPYQELVARYARCGLALDLFARNPERELAFTTRTVVYLWCGLPVLYNDYSELSPLIERYQAGLVLDPADRGAIKNAVRDYLQDPERIRRESANARRLVAEKLDWNSTVAPLAQWCANPAFRPDKDAALEAGGDFLAWSLERSRRELAATRSALDTLRGKWFVRLGLRCRYLAPLLAPLAWLLAWPLVLILRLRLASVNHSK